MVAFPDRTDEYAAPAVPAATEPSTALLVPVAPDGPSDTERLGDEIARLAAHLHAATYQLLVLIREFDERGGWGGGFLSCAHWLSWRTGIGSGPAREKVRVARALAALPHLSEAMASGQLSYSKVRALTRVATPENEVELLKVAECSTAAHIEKMVRAWRYVDRIEGAEEEQRRHQSRYLRLHPDNDGTYVMRGRLDPEVGALLETALEWASEMLYREAFGSPDADANPGQRRADALGLLAERALASAHREGEGKTAGEGAETEGDDPGAEGTDRKPARPGGRAERFQVVVHVDAPLLVEGSEDGLAYLAGSAQGVSAETSRRLACDASVVPMIHGPQGEVLDVGRKRRTVPPSIRRALDYRDQGCCFPGCESRYTDAHHITHWADGGETKLENLVLLCSRHHRAVHEDGFRVESNAGGGVEFFRSDGRRIPTVPIGPPAPEQPVLDLVKAHEAKGITPDEWTPTPYWHGETFDYGMAIDSLWQSRAG